jgi:hypothetical protein
MTRESLRRAPALFAVCAIALALAGAPYATAQGFVRGGAQPPAAPAAKAKAPESPKPAAAAPRQFIAVEHARKAGVKACLQMLETVSAATMDAEQAAASTWNVEAPDKHMFSSLSYASFANRTAPRALGVASVAPLGANLCDGAGVRVQPSALSCDQIAANLKTQKAPEPQLLGDARVYQMGGPAVRTTLLPSATTGCVVVTSVVIFGK